jgi:hypothetical protein
MASARAMLAVRYTNACGGNTHGAYGQGATHTCASGAMAYHPPGYGGYYGYLAYHPPVAVPYYSAASCYGCAAAAGAVVGATSGMAVGAAAASAVPTFKRWATNPTFRFDCEPTLPFFNRELIGKRAHLSGVVKSAATNRSG